MRTEEFDLAVDGHLAIPVAVKCPFSRRVEFWVVVNGQQLRPVLSIKAKLCGEPPGLWDVNDINHGVVLFARANEALAQALCRQPRFEAVEPCGGAVLAQSVWRG